MQQMNIPTVKHIHAQRESERVTTRYWNTAILSHGYNSLQENREAKYSAPHPLVQLHAQTLLGTRDGPVRIMMVNVSK